MSISDDSIRLARDLQEMAKRHYPDEDSDMEFYALKQVVATLCSDRITDHVEMFRKIYDMLNDREDELVYNDLDNKAHTVSWKPSSYRLDNKNDRILQFQLHTQNVSYWVIILDYSHGLTANDEVYIYQARVTGPDYKNKYELEDFMGDSSKLYLDARDECFLGCSYSWTDDERKFPSDSNYKFHEIRYMLDNMQWLYHVLTQG